MLTALTYGLSLGDHDDWTHATPELCLTIRSHDDEWAVAIASLAEQGRGNVPFRYGDTFGFDAP